MLKFIRNHADKIENINIWPIIGLVIFVTFFIAMLVYVKKMSRDEIHELSSMPLDLQDPKQPLNL